MADVFFPERLTQTATYWARSGHDGFRETYAAPVTIDCYWQDLTDMIRTGSGEERRSRAQVIVDRDVPEGGHLALGDRSATADPLALDEAWEIQRFDKLPGAEAEVFVRIAYL